MTRVKICGCRGVEDAIWAAEAGADFIGLNFAPKSPRRIGVEEASEIVRALGPSLREMEQEAPPALYRSTAVDLPSWFEHGASALERLLGRKRPLTVGVFAGNSPDEINEIVEECGIDLVQLSGEEPWSSCLLANRQVIKAVHIHDEESGQSITARIETGSALAVLLDRADPERFGGTGKAFDWTAAAELSMAMPVWLAGGLTPENVRSAISAVRPWCVDVSTGVETGGVKDEAKITAFLGAVREADE